MLRRFSSSSSGWPAIPEHGKLFHRWGATLAEASAKVGVTSERLVYLVDQNSEDDKLATGRSTREEIQKAIDGFAKAAAAGRRGLRRPDRPRQLRRPDARGSTCRART